MAKHNRNDEAIHKIAEKLKMIRKQAGLLQKPVTRETGVNVGDVEAELTNLSITTLARLCRYYGITLTEFFKELEM